MRGKMQGSAGVKISLTQNRFPFIFIDAFNEGTVFLHTEGEQCTMHDLDPADIFTVLLGLIVANKDREPGSETEFDGKKND